jgi:pyruvyltransferase
LLNPTSIPVVYFTGTPNVGDLLNEYLIPRISGRDIVKVKSSMQPHLRAVGSVVGSASRFSRIWGSGSINGDAPNRTLRKENIYALRGQYTLELIRKNVADSLDDLPLGDPAVLMPRFFLPDVEKTTDIGIVPHFSDEAQVRGYLSEIGEKDVKIISVQQDPESFITQLCACRKIYSSSLHGLILADSYKIPNNWVSFSDKLLGGEFKFMDYYSTTVSHNEGVSVVSDADGLNEHIKDSDSHCTVKSFTEDEDLLLQSFPKIYMRDS